MQKSYYANGQQIVLTADPAQVAVRFREPAPMSMRATVAERLNLGPFGKRQELPGEKYTILSVDPRGRGVGGDRLGRFAGG